jgi:hypothetical protein
MKALRSMPRKHPVWFGLAPQLLLVGTLVVVAPDGTPDNGELALAEIDASTEHRRDHPSPRGGEVR